MKNTCQFAGTLSMIKNYKSLTKLKEIFFHVTRQNVIKTRRQCKLCNLIKCSSFTAIQCLIQFVTWRVSRAMRFYKIIKTYCSKILRSTTEMCSEKFKL